MRGRLLLAAVGAWAAAGAATAVTPPSPTADALVAQLGSDRYAEREAAARALQQMGPAALPSLNLARRGADPELRRRADAIADRLQRAADAVKLLAAKPVRLDYQNVPLGTALNDLKGRTGINLALDSDHVANPLRPVTVRTAELPPWEAVEAFAKAAGLREVFRPDLDPPKADPNARRARMYAGQMPPAVPAHAAPVVLADGTADPPPGDRSTAVRVLLLPPTFPANRVVLGAGEVTLNLDVAPIPGRDWQEISGVTVRRAVGADGRPVPTSHRVDTGTTAALDSDTPFVVVGGRMVMWNGDRGDGTPAGAVPNPRVVPLTLRTRDSGIRSLRLLEGAVQVDLTLPNETLAAVDDVTHAVGASVESANGTRLTVVDTRQAANGRTGLTVRLDGPSLMTQFPMRGRFLMMARESDPVQRVGTLRVVDADDKELVAGPLGNSTTNDDGTRMTSEMTLLFRPPPAGPVRLIYVGPKTVTVDVPFRVENVPLP